ncbi:MAG TPA: cation:proton antiporter [Candidatus Dormibacteraeota bacterium]
MTAPTDLLSSIGICVAVAALLALVGNKLRQPLILTYLVAGVIIGPIGLNLVGDRASIQTVAEIGLILLLFIIGLEIDLKKLISAGRAVALTGALQVPLCIAAGLGVFALLGFRIGHGDFGLIYLAACMSMSSTMIVVKLLYDKLELDTLPGRITLGVLVFQDLWAVVMLAIQPNLVDPNLAPLLASVLKGVLLIIWSVATSRYILPRLFRSVAKVPELIVISALAWCFFLAAAASLAGLSKEMGALIAGISLSTFPYNLDVIAKVTSIRDFFVTLFFVGLGMEIPLPSWHLVLVAVVAAILVLLSRLLVVPILYGLRMGHRASILPAINLGNVSEFSIVIASLGLAKHQIGSDVVTVVILVFAIGSVASTYLIGYSHPVYDQLSRVLKYVGIRDLDHEHGAMEESDAAKPIVFLGFFREASSVLYELELRARRGQPAPRLSDLQVVDFNPHVIRGLKQRGVACVYGDIAHNDTLEHARVDEARLILSTIPDEILRGTNNSRLLRSVRRMDPAAAVIVTSTHIDHALRLYEQGADWVFIPRLHGAADVVDVMDRGLNEGFEVIRRAAVRDLKSRDEVLV